MKVCRLPVCQKTYTQGYGSFCCKRHGGQYSAFVRHKKINPVDKINYYKFIGPKLPTPKKKYKDYSSEQRGKHVARVSARAKRIKQATPKWADLDRIKLIYVKAQELSKVTGVLHEVDHIIPISNELVCGLHVEHNLQILTEYENQTKNNKFSIE